MPEISTAYRTLPDKFAPDKSRLESLEPWRSQFDQSIAPLTSRLSGTLSPSLSISGLQFNSKPSPGSKSTCSTPSWCSTSAGSTSAGSTSAIGSEYSNSTSDKTIPNTTRSANPIDPLIKITLAFDVIGSFLL